MSKNYDVMILLFWMSLAVILYTYAGYPLCLALLKKLRPRTVRKGPYEPTVSVVIAACNEENNIIRRLENLLAQQYPSEKLEIVVVSDGSEDRTVEYARRFEADKVRVVELSERKGKVAALNVGVAEARGELVVFCDARQTFEENVIKELACNFLDKTVGCVSGELILLSNTHRGIEVELGAYWKYEKWIRKAESISGSVVGATGAIYAIRRALYKDLPHGTLLDDVLTPMHVVVQGYRTVFDGRARAHDMVSQNVSQEWVRKVRTLAGNWQLFSLMPSLLIPWKNPSFWRFISHKVLRLLVPVALVGLLVSGALLKGPVYQTATWLQFVFYCLAALGGTLPASRNNRIVNVSYFFLIMNVVAIAGFWRWARGRCATAWQPAYAKDDR